MSEHSEDSLCSQYIYNCFPDLMHAFVLKGNIHEMKAWPQILTKEKKMEIIYFNKKARANVWDINIGDI